MNNTELADQLDTLADMLEFQGANSFRTNAYRNGARRLRQLTESVEKLVADNVDLTSLEGIGKSVAERCRELVTTGKLEQLEEIFQEIPRTVLDLLRVPKLGPKKAAALYAELGVTSLPELQAACVAGQVRELAGFGAKTEQALLAGIPLAEQSQQRMLWVTADQWVQRLREHFRGTPGLQQLEFAGSYRRGRETVGDLDILVVAEDAPAIMDRLAAFEPAATLLGRGDTKMSLQLAAGLQIDLRVVPATSFGAALQYFTGSKEHNVVTRRLAKERGWKLNEWGLFREDDDSPVVVAADEVAIYQALGLPWIPPELRENIDEFSWAQTGKLPRLIELADIKGDLHMHTTATDGAASIEEMAVAAAELGLGFIAITDHSQRVTVARGLNAARLLQQWDEIDAWNATHPDGLLILKGIECDILEDGGMDLPDDVLALADWVIASVHFGQQQDRKQITERIIGALENPHVDMLAHPTGRLVNRREPYAVDLDAVMEAAKRNHKFLELNASPRRLDLNEVHLRKARELGIPIVINTDAHHPQGLREMRCGIIQARRAGLEITHVANAWSWPAMRGYLEKGELPPG